MNPKNNPAQNFKLKNALTSTFGSLDLTTIGIAILLLALIGWSADSLLNTLTFSIASPLTHLSIAALSLAALSLLIKILHKKAQGIGNNLLIEATQNKPKRLDAQNLIFIVSPARHLADIDKKLQCPDTQKNLQELIEEESTETKPTTQPKKKYQWYMPYSTIKEHQPKNIYPIFTSGEYGSSKQKETFLNLFRGIFPDKTIHDADYQTLQSTDLTELSKAYDKIEQKILNDDKYRPNQILVDVTGGQASMSAMLAVNSTIDDAIISYVDTNDYKIHYFDFRSHNPSEE